MKFGIYSSIANPPRGEDLPRCVDEVIEEARLAEQAGFDSCFFGEHHQDKDGFLPSPLIVCTAVAASTTTLRVGTSVILLPLHHPVRLAEDVVTLDIISKGRVTVGVGLGYQDADFDAVLDLGRVHRLHGAGAGFLQDVRSWIWMPAELVIEVSTDGTSYQRVATKTNAVALDDYQVKIKDWKAEFEPVDARWIRIHGRDPGPIPQWHPGHGGQMILFVDELILQLD